MTGSRASSRTLGRFCVSERTRQWAGSRWVDRAGPAGRAGSGATRAMISSTSSGVATDSAAACCRCAACSSALLEFQSCGAGATQPRILPMPSPTTVVQGMAVTSRNSANAEIQMPLTACRSRQNTRRPPLKRGYNTPPAPRASRGHHRYIPVPSMMMRPARREFDEQGAGFADQQLAMNHAHDLGEARGVRYRLQDGERSRDERKRCGPRRRAHIDVPAPRRRPRAELRRRKVSSQARKQAPRRSVLRPWRVRRWWPGSRPRGPRRRRSVA